MSIVTVADCCAFCRLPPGTDHGLLAILLDGAESYVEMSWGIGLTEETHEEWLDGGMHNLWPWHYPVVSVTEVYDEEDGEAEDSDDYYLRGRYMIRRDGGGVWAAGSDRLGRGRYKVTYVAGFGSTYPVPGVLRSRVVLPLVARAYDTRGGVASESSAGHTVNWQALGDTDIFKALQGIRPGAMIG